MPWTQDFEVSAPDARPRTVQVLDFSNGQNTTEAVNAALLSVVQKAIDAGAFASLTRRRSGEDFRIPGARYRLSGSGARRRGSSASRRWART